MSSIVPSGRAKKQVNQSDFYNASIFDKMLSKIALTTPSKDAIGNADGIDDGVQYKGSDDLQSAMGDSSSAKLNLHNPTGVGNKNLPDAKDAIPQNSLNGNDAEGGKNGWLFDPRTGEPLNSLSGMDAFNTANSAFAENRDMLDIEIKGDPNSTNWSVTVHPRATAPGGKLVSKTRG